MAPDFLKGVNEVAKKLWGQLMDIAATYPNVIDEVRGSGLMIGVKCKVDSSNFRSKLLDARMLSVGAADNVIRILPPLIINDSHIDEASKIFYDVCSQIDGAS
jgi:acetylornithine/N-succinyldiaminopimelate aminotransferase